MTSPADFTKSLASTRKELRDLPHITKQNTETYEALNQALSKLGDVLSNSAYESWTETETNLALQSLNGALVNTSSLVSNWKKRRLRLVLNKSTFVDELSDAVMEIQKSWVELQVSVQALQNHREAARAIGEQLNSVAEGLRVGEPGNIAEDQLKEEVPWHYYSGMLCLWISLFKLCPNRMLQLLDFRLNHSKSKTFVTWLVDYLETDVHSIEQDLQKMKENADDHLNTQRDMGTKLLEQLILSLYELEKQSGTLASTKAKLICTICNSQMVACSGEAEEQLTVKTFTENGKSSDASLPHRESSDCHIVDESLDTKAQLGLEYLNSPDEISVQQGFHDLIECASSPGGRLAVFNAKYTPPPPAAPVERKVIRTVIEKVKDSTYAHLAVKLMAALTSSKGGASQNSGEPDSRIILKDDVVNFIVSLMNEEGLAKNRLLAAETLANILVNKAVLQAMNIFWRKQGIVPSLVALSNANKGSHKDREKANRIGLKGLQRLANSSMREEDCIGFDKTKKIVFALIKLLKKGLKQPKELEILVRDSLVALDNQVLEMDHGTSTSEVCEVVWEEMKELMKIEGISVSHTSVPGRMAIINIMTKLCGLYKEGADKHVFLYLLKMIKDTRSEIKSLSDPSPPSLLPQGGIENQTERLKKNLTELVNRSVRLLCLCVTHGQSTAQSVLKEHGEEGRTLEELLVDGETLGISDESRLEILSILDQIDILSTQTVTILVKASESKNQNCRRQVARKLRTLVEGKHSLTEFIEAKGIAALLLLLNDPNLNCRQDALVALQALTPNTAIPVDKLPLDSVLYFLIQMGPNEVTNAATGLFDLMVEGNVVSADKFLESKGVLDAILRLLDTDSDSPASQNSASALLVMAKKDRSIRTRIAEHGLHGLDILVKYARNLGNEKVKELLTATLVLFCRDGETYQKAITEADGHRFLIAALRERISREEAARGLLKLIENTHTIDIVLNQIYSDSSSDSELLILLEHCPDRSVKNAAASIISRLYPLLYRTEDSTRRESIREKCQLLLDYLDPFVPDYVKGFLLALAALAAEPEGRKRIHESHGHKTLINHLSATDTGIQGLVLKILSEMSSDNGVETHTPKMIRIAFMRIKVGEKVFELLKSEEFGSRTESMKDALILVRNLNLAGPSASSQLVEEGAISVLLEVLKRRDEFLLIVTELALKALEKVLDERIGKEAFIKGGGIKTLVAIVKTDVLESTGDVLGRTDDAFRRANVATIILIKVASDPYSRKLRAIETIFEDDILTALSKIIFYGQSDKIKWQAAVLMKLLAMYGPSKVFIAMKEKDCLDALISLRSVRDCKEAAIDALDYVSGKNKACKMYIQERNN